MDLILWRHADAEDGEEAPHDDLKRKLTARGERQAARVALWLHRQMPDGVRILVSPAVRAQRTAARLERKFTTVESIGPGASAKELLAACGWPDGRRTVLLVGHQLALGELASLLLTGREAPWTIRKGAVWWLRSRVSDTERDGAGRTQTYVVCVQSPETM
jgi:phosphohistidine phosphatase